MSTENNLVQSFRDLFAGDESYEVPSVAMDVDDLFWILSNERRRLAVLAINEFDEQTDLSRLADHVAAEHFGTPVGQTPSDDRKKIYVGLYQSHLPKLHDAGVVQWDGDQSRVSPTPRTERVAEWARVAEQATAGGGINE